MNLEVEYRKASSSDHERQKDFLRRSIEQADKQTLVLSEQQQNEEEGVQADDKELQKARAAYGNGSLPSFRVAEFRRAVLYSSTRQLQTTNQLMQVKRARAEFARELEKIDDQRQIRLLAELQEATVESDQRPRKAAECGRKTSAGWPETSTHFGRRQQGRYHCVQKQRKWEGAPPCRRRRYRAPAWRRDRGHLASGRRRYRCAGRHRSLRLSRSAPGPRFEIPRGTVVIAAPFRRKSEAQS